jgi:methionyl-tRNA synthetase
VMAKDILRFHAVIWPALLKAADMEYPRRLAIHGFLLMGEKKMSKSLGNVIDPVEVVEKFGADALRHYCFREVSFGNDGAVSAAGFEERYEAELANEWGNLASRTLAMIERYRDGTVPAAEPDPAVVAGEDGFGGLMGAVEDLIDRAELTQALGEIWDRVRRLNRYVEESRPWDLAKDDARGDDLDRVLYSLAEGARVLALLLHPYMPATSDRLLDALDEPGRELAELGSRGGGQRIERIPPLFPKLEG